MRYAYKPGTPEIARQAARERADWYIGHAHGALPAAAIAAARYGARLGFDCEDLLAESECGDPPDIVRRIERVYLPQCDAVFVTSLAMEHRLTSLYGSLPTTVLYNVPSESMATGMVPPNRRTQPGPLRLYWIGQTVGPKRAIEDAVRAAVLLHGDAEIHLRGEVARGYREQLLESARPAGVANLIHFHGRVAPDAVVRTMDEFDVGLALQLSSDLNANLTTSNKLFGYMLAGLAIAGTDTAGHREVMSAAPGAGFLYSGGNVEALAGRLKGWADRRDMLLAAQMAAWNGARSRFTWDIEKQSYVMALEAPSSNQPVDAPESDSAVV
jgi:glycosyltransferase involved in cell wall biosynthesis